MTDDSRRTAQRDAVARVFREAEGPLTTQEAFDRARAILPALGMATVYRAVKRMHDGGQIRAVTLPDGKTRYETAGLAHHAHFTCRVCDGVFDLDDCPACVPAGATLSGGFRVEKHEVSLFGTCPNCAG